MGKTFQTHQTLKELDVAVCDLPGSAFENENAGAPADMMQEYYHRASSLWAKGHPAAIVIDDADAAIGEWGAMTQYTVNRQLVCGTLMALADNPYVCYTSNGTMKVRVETFRVPIIMTCNDSSKLYSPLMRPGRTRMFSWLPSIEEKSAVVGNLFPELDGQDVETMVRSIDGFAKTLSSKYGCGAPVSLYSDIRSFLDDEWLHSVFDGYTARDMMTMTIPKRTSVENCSLGELVKLGKTLLSDDKNYLEA